MSVLISNLSRISVFNSAPDGLEAQLKTEIRERLLISTDIKFVSFNTIPRETYKSKLVVFEE